MSEFHEGRVAATFQVGHRVEDTKEAYEKEIVGLDGMKAALVVAVKGLEEYALRLQQDGANAKVAIKETDIGLKYINNCIDLLKKMYQDTEAKRFAAVGAIEALKRVVADIKAAWDQETKKLKEIQEFDAEKPHDMTKRPVGYMPAEKPIEEYKQAIEQAAAPEPDKPKKKARKAPKTQG